MRKKKVCHLDMIDNIFTERGWCRLNRVEEISRGIIRNEVEECDPSEWDGVKTRPHVDTVMSLLGDYAESFGNIDTQTERSEQILVAICIVNHHTSG